MGVIYVGPDPCVSTYNRGQGFSFSSPSEDSGNPSYRILGCSSECSCDTDTTEVCGRVFGRYSGVYCPELSSVI